METNGPEFYYDRDSANMAVYNNKPVMIGCHHYNCADASYFETYDPFTENWSKLNRNPFFGAVDAATSEYLGGTSVTKKESFIIFGGLLNNSNEMKFVLEYKNDIWKNLGTRLSDNIM